MLSEIALNSIRNHLKDNIAYAKFKAGGVSFKSEILESQILDDGRIAVMFIISHAIDGNIIATEVQLFDADGNLWASKAEKIVKKDTQDGIMYRFLFRISEE